MLTGESGDANRCVVLQSVTQETGCSSVSFSDANANANFPSVTFTGSGSVALPCGGRGGINIAHVRLIIKVIKCPRITVVVVVADSQMYD